MRKRAIVFAIIVALASCKGKPTAPLSVQKSATDSTQLLIAKLKPILQGVWVKQDYIQKVIASKSPLAGLDKVIGITTIQFNIDNIEADSLQAKVSYDNQQAGGVELIFRPGKHTPAMPFGENELSYSINGGDTSLILHQFYQNNWVLTPYVRALKNWNGRELQEGIIYLINKNIFAGTYQLTDDTGKTCIVKLSIDGRISGMPNFSTYLAENTFDSKLKNNLDQITFDIFSSNEKTYAFNFEGNTLNLYETKTAGNSTQLLQGKLKYKLVKLNDQ
ncbi:hypothetical protein [Mucilaginibacter sp.]|uniref:hypothetical protein n=1 Tax=Mucilaginibacter sp. TaxID=1882438 RepID=UPI0035BC59C9